jgi:hypothetical protein
MQARGSDDIATIAADVNAECELVFAISDTTLTRPTVVDV